MANQHFTHSTLRERVVEHVFVGEALRTLWRRGVFHVEVLRSEFDAHGYDLVMVRRRIMRHIQFKTGTGKRPGEVSVGQALATKASGCVIWIHVNDDLEMGPYFWFGGLPGEPLPSIEEFANPLRATHNKDGVRPVRQNHRLVPPEKFEKIDSLEEVLVRLLGEFRYDVKKCRGSDLADAELTACATIVETGGAVTGASKPKLQRASELTVARCLGDITALGAIKALSANRTASVSRSSGVDVAPTTPEVGYIAVHKDHKGNDLSYRIVSHLLAGKNGPFFSTTDDERMKSVLKKFGFTRRGDEWHGNRGLLSLWIRD